MSEPTYYAVKVKARREDYHKLCIEKGVPTQWRRWCAHYADLRGHTVRPYTTKEDYRAWWLERFTLDEIHQMAGALDSLLREDEGSTVRWEEKAA